jgi:hypothetical protein
MAQGSFTTPTALGGTMVMDEFAGVDWAAAMLLARAMVTIKASGVETFTFLSPRTKSGMTTTQDKASR